MNKKVCAKCKVFLKRLVYRSAQLSENSRPQVTISITVMRIITGKAGAAK